MPGKKCRTIAEAQQRQRRHGEDAAFDAGTDRQPRQQFRARASCFCTSIIEKARIGIAVRSTSRMMMA